MEAAAATLVRPEELAAQTRTGDREVFVSLYEPDFDGVFDLVLRTVRDGKVAAAVLRDALETAWDVFREQGAPYDVSGWLYALARESALNCPARRRSAAGEREGLDYTQVDPERLSDPSVGFDKELMEVVWDAATGFYGDDYSLLDLHVRRDLSVDEVAEHLDQPRDEIAGRLSRLCDSFNDAVSTTLLATRARHNCAGLDADLSRIRLKRAAHRTPPRARVHALPGDQAPLRAGDGSVGGLRFHDAAAALARADGKGFPGAPQGTAPKATLSPFGRSTQRGERLPYKQRAGGSSRDHAALLHTRRSTLKGWDNGSRRVSLNT